MKKLGYFGIISLLCITIFASCSNNFELSRRQAESPTAPAARSNTPYGSYLAGRVAHLRRDFNTASDYYIKSLKADPSNKGLMTSVYLLLVSKGRVAEAAEYARLALANGDTNNFVYIIISTEQMKQQDYQGVIQTLSQMNAPIYKDFINPLVGAWAYAGLNDQEKAFRTLNKISHDPSFKALYYFHAGMLNDYFGNTAEAEKNYNYIAGEESVEMSFRALQIIANFYLRNNQKEKAEELVQRYSQEKLLSDMLNQLEQNIAKADPKKTKPIVDNPNIGMSEALFSIAATLRQGVASIDLAHMFISLSIYANPHYDLAKMLLADILESREMYADANEIYETIDKSSETYNTIQLRLANNYVMMEDYASAELLLKSLALDNPDNFQLYLDLGDILRLKNEQNEAIKYYEEAIEKLPQVENQHWVLFYALGISYERSEQWDKAEKAFIKALELSQNHYLVLNYLGYSWLKSGKNVEQAFGMIVDAYNQAPQDGNIADSLGWALYRLGYYNEAVTYLEKAAELEPANAVINEHLGDAYWFAGRRNEAGFQWKHALTMKDDSGEMSIKNVKNKIASGIAEHPTLSFDKKVIDEKISEISQETPQD